MLNILRIVLRTSTSIGYRSSTRTFLSQAYYCNEVWEHRLRSPVLNKVNVYELYQDLDQRITKTGEISPVDVDIFANVAKEESFIEEVIDVIHKLRSSAAASNTLESTSHAVTRLLMQHKKYDDLLKLLSDRLNYGIFLDFYTANLLMDIFYLNNDFVSGVRVASQLMLQEEREHQLSVNLSLLHCYKYLTNPQDWPQEPQIEEPEEEIKVRVKYLRNPYFDDHFDLSDPNQIVGKTLWMLTKDNNDILNTSLHILGLELHGKTEKASEILNQIINDNKKLYAEILNILPEDNIIRKTAASISESGNVEELLIKKVKDSERTFAEKDISLQCEKYLKWEQQRKEAIEEQYEKLLIQKKLTNIEDIQRQLKERETKLWFFENEEKLELAINAKRVFYPKRWFGKKKAPRKINEGYIPPEIK